MDEPRTRLLRTETPTVARKRIDLVVAASEMESGVLSLRQEIIRRIRSKHPLRRTAGVSGTSTTILFSALSIK
jgi:hypothetical protein